MEDENGIELSLGLSCGGSAGKSKGKDGSSDLKTEEGDNSKSTTNVKHFLHLSIEKLDSNVPQRGDLGIQQQENFWTDLGKCSGKEVDVSTDTTLGNSSQFTRYQELWTANNNRSAEVVEDISDPHETGGKLWPEASHKRKMPFEEIKHQKKHESEVESADSQAVQVPHSSSEALAYEGKASELAKGVGNQHNTSEEVGTCSSSHVEDEAKGNNNVIFMPKEISDQQPVVEGFTHEGSAIRSGIASSLKFGGCGSYPDLPWVSATGPGPNGRTISGVTYKYGKNQIRVVCACHGSHMSSEEFIQHANSDAPNPENNTGLASFPGSNPATSTQS
ncbi:putative interactor of JAZ [Tasmannia lanceolata]|uniref:putative interactor of JAZ n=1 Tax=Tasmannia lanceolata TaxID=3420 RepID=UPI0040641BA6